jgi:peptidoglycan/LPS O-acetylase OafA/YrhL
MVVSAVFFALFGFVNGPQIVAGILYYMNIYLLIGGSTMPLDPLWSLAVEEHYYLLFPLIFAGAWKFQKRLFIGLVVAVLAVLAWRFLLVVWWHVTENRTYLATDTRIDSILYGAILAVALKTDMSRFTQYFSTWPVLLIALVSLLFTFLYRDDTFRETFRYSLQGLAIIPLFFSTLFSGKMRVARYILETRPLIWIGKLSYSLYLWHMPVLFFSGKIYPAKTAAIIIPLEVFATLALATLSYYCVEQNFQKMRDHFRLGPHYTAKLKRR